MSKAEYKRLGDYIREVNVRNRDLKVSNLLGVSISKEFMPSIANTIGTDMSTYKIVERGQFAYGPVTSRNGDKVSIALLDDYDNAIISQAYTVFEVTDHGQLLPEYLMMWFRRPEFDRYARFHSHGSAREIFDWDELCDVMLPIPSITRPSALICCIMSCTCRRMACRSLLSFCIWLMTCCRESSREKASIRAASSFSRLLSQEKVVLRPTRASLLTRRFPAFG